MNLSSDGLRRRTVWSAHGTFPVLAEETIKSFLLSNGKLSRLDTRVVYTEEGIDVVHGLCTDVCELLDLGSNILDLYEKSQSVCENPAEQGL